MRANRSWILTVGMAAACAGNDTDGGLEVVVRDSAGVTIMENRVRGGVVPVYAEVGEPDLDIGAVEGDPAYLFTTVIDVNGLDDGGVLVTEWQTREVRHFDATGRHLRSLGGVGEGPGEFTQIVNVAGVRGDTVRVWDIRTLRLTTLLLDGTFVSDVTADRPRQAMFSRGQLVWLNDGTYVIEGRDLSALDLTASSGTASMTLLRLDALGEPIDTVASAAGEEFSIVSFAGADERPVATMLPTPLGRRTYWAARDDRIVTGWNGRYRIEERTPTGVLARVLAVPSLERPLHPSDFAAARAAALDRCTNEVCSDIQERVFDELTPPELLPSFSALQLDAAGRLWVAEYAPSSREVSGWHVFSTAGELLGRVAIPVGFEVFDIGADYLLGVLHNSLDVPFVRRYPLIRLR